MIFNSRLLYLHVPKTGGMAITSLLLRVLPPPTYYSHPPGQDDATAAGVTHIPGPRHETLAEAQTALEARGLSLDSFPLIVAAIRNAYDIEVSRYAYLQKGHPWDRGVDQTLALTRSFETFARRSGPQGGHCIEEYYTLDGETPPALELIRFENLADGIASCLRRAGLEAVGQLPRVNTSRRAHFASYYTPAAEEAVYHKYQWVFDNGFYDRMPGAHHADSGRAKAG